MRSISLSPRMKLFQQLRMFFRVNIPVEIFTPNAQMSVAMARRAAAQCKHVEVDTEHLLVGILWLKECAAFSLLEAAGIPKKALFEALDKSIVPGSSELLFSSLQYSKAVKKVLAFSSMEADRVGSEHVGTDHFLLGILRYGQGGAFRVMRDAGLKLDALEVLARGAEEAKRKAEQGKTSKPTPPSDKPAAAESNPPPSGTAVV